MVYVFLAQGFEIVEALAPVDIMRRAKLDVKTVGVTGKTVVSSNGIPVTADITTKEMKLDNELDLIVLPGGMPGANNLEADRYVQEAIDFCVDKDRYVSAICAAPKILGHKGLLKGRKATCFPGFENDLEGAILTDELAVKDGKFITGKGAGAAFAFGFKLVELLVGADKAAAVSAQMQCR
ncbi:MAG: DJ-1/PfpI family protein [Ruminococcus sp.]|nr:DJ-1/PfpI family protein [Ruminococcus sp.]